MHSTVAIENALDELVRSIPHLEDDEELELVKQKITYLEGLLEEAK